MGGLLEIGHAFLHGAVVVLVEGNADIPCAGDEVVGDRTPQPEVGNLQRPADSVVFAGAALLVLGFLEVGQDIGVAPARIAQRNPALVVFALAAHVEQAVERTGAAQHFTARPLQLAIGDAGIGLGEVAPVQFRVVHGLEVTDRDVDPGIPVFAAGFEQQNAGLRILRQPVGQDATCRSGADYDVVENFGHSRFLRVVRLREVAHTYYYETIRFNIDEVNYHSNRYSLATEIAREGGK